MNKALFLDLDNTLIYTSSGRKFPIHSEDWIFNLNLLPLIDKAYHFGYKIIIITNQERIEQGLLNEVSLIHKLETICKQLEKDFKFTKNSISYKYCKSLNPTYYKKPNVGMVYEVALDYELDLSNSIMIGNNIDDKECANKSGIYRYYDVTEIGLDIIL